MSLPKVPKPPVPKRPIKPPATDLQAAMSKARSAAMDLNKAAHLTLREFAKLAVEKEKEFQGKPSDKAVEDFLARNPSPTDAQYHEFAEKHKFNKHLAEQIAYRLAAKYVKFLRGGKSNEPGAKHYDPKQMKAGVEVEAEHTPDIEGRKKITRDHLAEFANYYLPHLRDLEKKLKAKGKK